MTLEEGNSTNAKGKKVDKLYYTEIENFNRSKENIKKVKRQTMD